MKTKPAPLTRVTADDKGYVKLPYSQLKGLVDHIRREHGLNSSCSAISDLDIIWAFGCDAAVSAREKKA